MLACWLDNRHIRIVVLRFCAAFAEQVHQDITGRFAVIIEVRFVSQSQNQNPRTIESLSLRVESSDDSIDDIFWHCCVDLARKFDKARMFAELTRFPSEIKRIDRNTVTAQSRAQDRMA